jgi:hypothetical protein
VLIEQVIYKLLKTNMDVTDLVAGRIFAGIVPQTIATFPLVMYKTPEDGGREVVRTIQGGCSLVRQRMRLFSAARTYGEAALLDAAVYGCLDEFFGTVINEQVSPPESIDIQGIFLAQPAHAHQFVDKTQLHEFISEFDCHFIDPSRLS